MIDSHSFTGILEGVLSHVVILKITMITFIAQLSNWNRKITSKHKTKGYQITDYNSTMDSFSITGHNRSTSKNCIKMKK